MKVFERPYRQLREDVNDLWMAKSMVFKTIQIIDDEETGKVVRGRRLSAGIGVRELAKIVGCSPAYVSDLENGRRRWTIKKYKRFMQPILERMVLTEEIT